MLRAPEQFSKVLQWHAPSVDFQANDNGQRCWRRSRVSVHLSTSALPFPRSLVMRKEGDFRMP
jgi:hypothetical protein